MCICLRAYVQDSQSRTTVDDRFKGDLTTMLHLPTTALTVGHGTEDPWFSDIANELRQVCVCRQSLFCSRSFEYARFRRAQSARVRARSQPPKTPVSPIKCPFRLYARSTSLYESENVRSFPRKLSTASLQVRLKTRPETATAAPGTQYREG